MATSSRSAERFKYGICLNDECSKCKTKEVQQISMRKELVCSECGKPLRECPPPPTGPDWKKIGAIIAAVVVVGGGAAGYFSLRGDGQETTTTEPTTIVQSSETNGEETEKAPQEESQTVFVEQITPNENKLTMKEGEKKTIAYTVTPKENDEKINAKSSDESVATVSENGEVTALKAGKAFITFAANQSGVSADIELIVEKKTETQPIDPNPSWGRYEGARQGGKPHGNGILYITRSYSINGETAQPGERIEGVFRDGYINMGTWYKKDGNAVVVKGIKVM